MPRVTSSSLRLLFPVIFGVLSDSDSELNSDSASLFLSELFVTFCNTFTVRILSSSSEVSGEK